MVRYPLIAPNPPRLADQGDALRRIDASGVYSNNGPELRAFEAAVTRELFGGVGASLGVANATLGLMIAIRHAIGPCPRSDALALVPAMTFAATAQAAEWAGLTPLIADVDPETWVLDAREEERLLQRYGARIAVVVPYAAFGAAIDLDRYVRLSRRFGVRVVVDAASSLGTIDADGRGFGADCPFAVVHSMHATKTFAVGEGGLIHSGDAALIAELRTMAGFGFERGRSATLPGINAKLAEVPAALAMAKLAGIDAICDNRAAIEETYRETLGDGGIANGLGAAEGFTFQAPLGRRRAMQFMPLLLPAALAGRRDEVAAALDARGIASGCYFSPHLGQQPWFRDHTLIEATPVADDLSARILSLPITDAMTPADARHIATTLAGVAARLARRVPARVLPSIAHTLLVGGGPAGTAMLTAAARDSRLAALAQGLVIAERDASLGGGRLGGYAIASDSTAQTFLTAVVGNPEPSLAALATHPAARTVERHVQALGVPLAEAGPLLRVIGDRLADLVRASGGAVLTGHEALGTQLTADGLWRTRLRRADGREIEQLSHRVVIATGGHQPLDRLAAQTVAGEPLMALAGDRLLQSDQVLAIGGLERVADLLSARPDPRIAVIGGSTSALTTIALLLRGRPALPLGSGGITLLHRRPLRPFYPSAEAALADGFTDWGPDDVCPVSGFVYRLGGFRLEARELVLRMLAVGGRRADPRVRLHRIAAGADAAAATILREADLVIAALGYRPHALPVADGAGRPIALAADAGAAMVDRHCRVLDAGGAPLPGLYGIGLAAGFVPWGTLGGEASFTGQANGLWLWQNDVGRMIVDQLLDGGAADASTTLARAAG
ncbi:DegT/DnrJ/EryC1/StrS family aminotransferase [uncultured Sphingomonas sp.]|uniref:DegT/DnrJ/EryC1/StrS family aminotransferase n=1 Tax=uncultured Sphingomonas sp. TaxID=158754 RepID=UPI0035C9A48A